MGTATGDDNQPPSTRSKEPSTEQLPMIGALTADEFFEGIIIGGNNVTRSGPATIAPRHMGRLNLLQRISGQRI